MRLRLKLILFYILAFYECSIAQNAELKCDGDLIVTHNSAFYKLSPNFNETTFSRTPFSINSGVNGTIYEAFAYRKKDNSIYGVD